MHLGSCLCRAITFQFPEFVSDYVLCHCKSCRKASGSAFGANISVPAAGFEIITGAENIASYESSPNQFRQFCATCGSPLFTKVGESPSLVRVRLGAMDTEFDKKPVAQIFMAAKAAWHDPDQNIMSFEEWPSGDALETHDSHQPKT